MLTFPSGLSGVAKILFFVKEPMTLDFELPYHSYSQENSRNKTYE